MREALRVGIVLTVGAFVGAIALSLLLLALVNLDARRPLLTEFGLQRIFVMSFGFCLFTLPIAWVLGFPIYFLFRRFHLLRVSVCVLTGRRWASLLPTDFFCPH